MSALHPPSDAPLGLHGDKRVRFLELLGQGGFGAVYRAELRGENGLVQHVAIKVLSMDMSAQADLAARQRDEARLLARLRHHAIVTVFDLTELAGRPAVVMELVEGVDASELRASAALTPRAAMQIVAETAGALDAAWSTPDPDTGRPLRVVHRDIKPANLLVSRHGGVKVLDFGVARAEFDREGVTGSVQFGTARYMAPEQWLSGTASHPVDVFALGVSLVELITGEALPRAPLQPERFRDHVSAAAEAAAAACGRTPGVDRLVRGMLAFDPRTRLTAAQVRDAALTLADTLPGAQLARLAPQVVPERMEARRARLAGRVLPGSLPLGAVPGGTPPPIDPAAPPALPTHLQGAQALRPQTPSERHRTLPSEDSGLTLALSEHGPPAPEPPPRRWAPLAAAGVVVALLAAGVLGWMGERSPRPEGPAPAPTSSAPDAPPASTDALPPGPTTTPDRQPPTAPSPTVPETEPLADGAGTDATREATGPSPKATAAGAARPRAAAPAEPTPQPAPASAPAHTEDAAPAEPAAVGPTPASPAAGSPATGTEPAALHAVTLSSDPLGARVWLDGEDLGTTPVVGAMLAEGDHRVRMVLGDAEIDGTIRVRRMRPVSAVKWRVESGRLSMQ